MTSSWGKNEDSIKHATLVRGPMLVESMSAGWIVATEMNPDVPPTEQFTLDQLALMGQSSKRAPAIQFEGATETDDRFTQVMILPTEQLAEMVAELLATFMTRDLFLHLKSILPEEMTR